MEHLTKTDVQLVIRKFLDGAGGPWDWDDFISLRIADPELEMIRRLAGELPDLYPPVLGVGYCNDEGLEVLRRIADDLQERDH